MQKRLKKKKKILRKHHYYNTEKHRTLSTNREANKKIVDQFPIISFSIECMRTGDIFAYFCFETQLFEGKNIQILALVQTL